MRLEHQTRERSIGRFLDPRSLRHTSSCQASEGKRNQTFTAVGIIFSVQLTSAAGSDLRLRRLLPMSSVVLRSPTDLSIATVLLICLSSDH